MPWTHVREDLQEAIAVMRQELLDKLYYNRAKIIRVIDADTMEMDIDLGHGVWLKHSKKSPVRIRLARIDAWEVRGEERERGMQAKERVKELFENLGGDVLIKTISKDSFGRWIADVWLGDGKNLSDLLLLEGHAELYKGS